MKRPKPTTRNWSSIKRYEAPISEGLTEELVETRKAAGFVNSQVDCALKSVKDILFENIFTYFNLIFFILGFLLCLVRSYTNLTFLPIIIINIGIGIFQGLRAKRILDKMNMVNAPHTLAIRNGQEIFIKSDELVIDDIVIWQAGNQICADAIVLDGEVQVNESLLTGESNEILKKKGDTLMSGSFIVSGRCHARLDKVGEDSFISKLTIEAKTLGKGEQSEMVRSLDKLVKVVGFIIIPIGLALFCQSYYVNNETFKESIISMEAAVIGMIPEGLYLLTTLALGMSTIRLAQQGVYLHNMKSIETLARVNVLCVDKTGTITENTMSVQDIIPTSESRESKESLITLLSDFCAAMSSDNSTMLALKTYFSNHTGRTPLSITGFSSTVKYSSVTFEDAVYVLGAPEMVLRDQYLFYADQLQSFTEKGYRVLTFCQYDGIIDGKALTGNVIALGFILLANPIRPDAEETFRYFVEQGVAIKVISGDNPRTVSEVAKKAGIVDADKYIDATTLTDYASTFTALSENAVFGRVTPEQKKLFVEILKRSGNTVAMTGDGVNDILAMKKADCSIAMASGNEAAIQVAQVVLANSNFSCMPSVVLEGRRVVNNLQRSASLFLMKNIFSLLTAILALIFAFSYPLEPSQITIVSVFTIGVPSFLLAIENNFSRIEGNFLINTILKAFPGGLTNALIVGAVVACGMYFNLSTNDVATTATLLLVFVGFMVLYKISYPLNPFRFFVLAINLIGAILAVLLFGEFFSLTKLTSTCLLLLFIFCFAAESLFRGLSFLCNRLGVRLFKRLIKNQAP